MINGKLVIYDQPYALLVVGFNSNRLRHLQDPNQVNALVDCISYRSRIWTIIIVAFFPISFAGGEQVASCINKINEPHSYEALLGA